MDADIITSDLIQKLENLLSNESPIIHFRFENEVRTAINNLQLLKRSLKHGEDSQQEASSGHAMNDQQMARLLQILCSVDYATDNFLISEALQQRRRVENSSEKFFQMPFMCFKSSCYQASSMKKFKNEVRRLCTDDFLEEVRKADASNIQEAGDNNIARMSFQNDNGSYERISDFYLEGGADVVGLEEQINDLVARLLPQHNDNVGQSRDSVPTEIVPAREDPDQSTQVIAVFDEGGSGKTTLVRTVYNRAEVKRHFNIRAWVNVSSVFKARDVLADILKQIDQDLFAVERTLSEAELISKITGLLNGGLQRRLAFEVDEASKARYLIVLENVQTLEAWKTLISRLCSSSHGRGRIIITSREDTNIVPQETTYSTMSIRRLNNEEGWKLFSKKVGVAEEDLNNSDLNTFKGQILNICRGLPLSVVLLGGLLSTKERSCEEWSRVIERATNFGGDIVGLSYEDLPSELKPCFLYMGLFPREFQIPMRRLRHLWFAERFLNHEKIAPEDLADFYLKELVIRNMIQVRWSSDGSPKTCRMASVLHDVFCRKAMEEGFFYHDLGSSHSAEQPQLAIQRLPACLGMKNFPSSFLHVRYLRSCVAFDTRIRVAPAREIGMLLEKIIFRLLRVLDLEDVYKPVLPDTIGKLLHLTYLGLRSTFIDSLPLSMDLPCLETLDVKETKIQILPSSISQAKKLQHLYLNWLPCDTFSKLHSESLSNLHTLWGVDININNERDFASNRKNLVKLKKLGLTCSSTSVLKAIAEWVSELTELQSFKLRSTAEVKLKGKDVYDLMKRLDFFMFRASAIEELKGEEVSELLTKLQSFKLVSTARKGLTAAKISELMTKLRSLNVGSSAEVKSIPMASYIELYSMANHHKLQNLYLLGNLQKESISDIHFLPPNLRNLTLSLTELEEDPMPLLGQLPQLNILRLFGQSYIGEQIKCLSGGFPKLHVLKLWKLQNLKVWTVEQGAMPCLRELELRNCEDVQLLTGLQHLTNLKELELTNMEEDFAKSLVGSNLYIKKNKFRTHILPDTSGKLKMKWMEL